VQGRGPAHAAAGIDVVGLPETGAGARVHPLHLTGQGVRVVGTDAWSWDAPFSHTARRYAATGASRLASFSIWQ
jgi:hypothetical protein